MSKIAALLKPKSTLYEQTYNVKFYEPKELEAPRTSILVYASNSHGRCGKGSSHLAIHKFRAANGTINGATGQAYALNVKNHDNSQPNIDKLQMTMRALKVYVNSCKTKLFFVSEIDKEITQETLEIIAPQFKGLRNIWLPEIFAKFVKG